MKKRTHLIYKIPLLIITISIFAFSGCNSKDKPVNLNNHKIRLVDRYLGMDNGKTSLADRKADEYATLLGLDTSYHAVMRLYKVEGRYFAIDSDYNLFSTNDLIKWEKSNRKVNGYPSIIFHNNTFILCDSIHNYYRSMDGVNFKKEYYVTHHELQLLEHSLEQDPSDDLKKTKNYIHLKNETIFFDEPRNSSLINDYEFENIFKKTGFFGDMIFLQDFIACYNQKIADKGFDGYETTNLGYLNYVDDTFYFLGKHGGILRINPDYSLDWVGLYPRTPLTYEQMTKENIGEKLGVVKKDGKLYYANTFLLGADAIYNIYSSNDGLKWNFEKTHRHSPYKMEGLTYKEPIEKNSAQYLGMENGKLSLTNKNIADYAKILNLDTTMPSVKELYYANGTYLAILKNNDIYVTNNLSKWNKTKHKAVKGFKVMTDPTSGFLFIKNNKYYVSKDGESWKHLKGMETFFGKKKPDVFFKNKMICYDKKSNQSKKMGSYTAIKSRRSVYSVYNEGDVLFGLSSATSDYWVNRETPGDDYVTSGDRTIISFDGVNWKSPTGSVNDCDMFYYLPNYNNKKIFGTYLYNCDDVYEYYSYTIEKGEVIITAEKDIKYFNGELTPEKSLFNLCANPDIHDWKEFNYRNNYLDKGVNEKVFEKNIFYNDIVMLQDFICDYETEYNYVVANNKFYFWGKYGGVIEIDSNFNQRWVGLYTRNTLSRDDMSDPSKGGKIGIVEKDNTLWYANTVTLEGDAYYKIYSSDDAVQWKYQFTKVFRNVAIKELEPKKK